MYNDVHHFVTTCESCQIHSRIRHHDKLHPTYPLTIHFKWMVELMKIPMGVGQIRYLVLARESLTNQVEGRALVNKTTATMWQFLIEEVICGRLRGVRRAHGYGVVRPIRGQALSHNDIQYGGQQDG